MSDNVDVFVGGNKLTLSKADSNPVSIIDFFIKHVAGDSVTARVINGELLIDATFAVAGVELRNNEVRHLPSTWDANFDEDALEIVNDMGNAIFQVVYRGGRSAVVNGIFRRLDNDWSVITDRGIVLVPATETQIAQVKIPMIFKYPSSEHFGERAYFSGR